MKSSRVPIVISLPKELERVEILIAADIHTGSAEFDEKKWAAFEELLKQPDKYVIFAGDQCEYATRSSKSDVYTQALSPSQQKRWWIEHLKKYKEKVLCIVDGNHEFNRASKDADDFPLYDIALALGIEDRYRSEGAFVDVGVGHIGTKGKQARYVFRVQHQAKNKTVAERDIENIVSGHFLRFGGYGERQGYGPTSTKLYSVILSGKQDKSIETRGFHL